MPIRTQTTDLLKFGFDSKHCKSCKASSEQDEKLHARIRKRDINDILDRSTYELTQIYVRADRDKPLLVQPGQSVILNFNRRKLIFKVSSIHVLHAIAHRPRFVRTAILSGSFS